LPDLPALPEPPCSHCGNRQPPYPNGQCRQCGHVRPESIDEASASEDDHFRFRVCWGDTGEWGILVIPKEHWNGFGTHYTSGDWVYAWSGTHFQPLRRLIHPPRRIRHPSGAASGGQHCGPGFLHSSWEISPRISSTAKAAPPIRHSQPASRPWQRCSACSGSSCTSDDGTITNTA
jgi:hypothetical protein